MELVNPGLTGVPGGVTVGHSFVCRIYVTKDDDLWQFLFFFFFFFHYHFLFIGLYPSIAASGVRLQDYSASLCQVLTNHLTV